MNCSSCVAIVFYFQKLNWLLTNPIVWCFLTILQMRMSLFTKVGPTQKINLNFDYFLYILITQYTFSCLICSLIVMINLWINIGLVKLNLIPINLITNNYKLITFHAIGFMYMYKYFCTISDVHVRMNFGLSLYLTAMSLVYFINPQYSHQIVQNLEKTCFIQW